MTIVRRTYDHGYFRTRMHRTHPDSQRNRKRLQLILTHQQQGRLLEIGPGTGEFLHLAARRFEIEGIEISADAVKAAPPDLREKLWVGNIEHDSLCANCYQIVAAFNVLEHLRNPQVAVNQVRHALAPGGWFVGSMPCNSGHIGRLYTRTTNFFDRTHCSTLEPGQWKAIFQKAGFAHITFFGEIPLGPRHCLYVRTRNWSNISANLMFACA